MKKFITVLIMFAVAMIGLTGCEDMKSHLTQPELTEQDIFDVVEKANNPEFTSVQEVMSYACDTYEAAYTDSVIGAMTYESIRNVATVLLKRYPSITKYDIVQEYTHNVGIYDNLPSSAENTNTIPADSALSTVPDTTQHDNG